MAAWRQAIELALGELDVAALSAIARSRTDPANRVERARMLLAYRDEPSFFAVAQAGGVHHQTVQRCVERALACGPIAALDDRPRSGREPTITAAARPGTPHGMAASTNPRPPRNRPAPSAPPTSPS